MIGFVFDTSAFLSLESGGLLDIVIKNFKILTSPSVIHELNDFAIHKDTLGKIAKEILNKKEEFIISEASTKEKLEFISSIDNDIFNLALSKGIMLVTDDIKLMRHCPDKINVQFSTYFLFASVESGIITKTQALQKLKKMRKVRNWRNNIIYTSSRIELEGTED